VLPSVFHPKIFLTSAFFARFLQSLDLQGKNVVEIGTGSGKRRSLTRDLHVAHVVLT
jgi:protein-L-isoaspartate O-methyltransferase